ncbi:Rv3235 family protein [Micromonospora sp. WMMD1120]|uniref:Rv3235 family protein n=1 Tax=Micromonospora sp. WMMD1120 TaxID=3016106 RepID=UPI002416C5BA|nr:Rv3235 family protein [Micromonospora sp. WMMD1120]MDG4808028.1 Rv3235 family protein [Micromonospora sp. WMMD1120]
MSGSRPGPSRPPVRLRPVPQVDPPYLDESDGPYWPAPTDGQLALDLFASTRPDPGRPPERRAALRSAPNRSASHPVTAIPSATASEATRAAHRFVGTCLEVVNGYRSPAQVRALLDPARATDLLTELARASGRTAAPRRRASRPVARLLRLRVCEPRQAAVETAAVVSGAGGRSWAMAIRLEHRRGRWLCTVLQIL